MQTSTVRIREVGPRDGFQNEPEVLATADKVRLIDALARTGLHRIEVTSFVRANVIPQLADGPQVLEAINVPPEVSLSVLVLMCTAGAWLARYCVTSSAPAS